MWNPARPAKPCSKSRESTGTRTSMSLPAAESDRRMAREMRNDIFRAARSGIEGYSGKRWRIGRGSRGCLSSETISGRVVAALPCPYCVDLTRPPGYDCRLNNVTQNWFHLPLSASLCYNSELPADSELLKVPVLTMAITPALAPQCPHCLEIFDKSRLC